VPSDAGSRPSFDALAASARPSPLEPGRTNGGVPPCSDEAAARYQALIHNLPDTVVAVFDRELRGVTIDGGGLPDDFDRTRFEGRPLDTFVGPEDFAVLEPHYRSALDGSPSAMEFVTHGSGVVYAIDFLPLRRHPDGPVDEVFTLARDITERSRADAEHRRRTAQQAAVAELGVAALEGLEVGALMDEAVSIVARTLGVELCEMLELSPGRESLLLRAGVGWKDGLVRAAAVPMGSEFYAGFTWGSRGRVLVDDWSEERRFKPTPILRAQGAGSSAMVTIGGQSRLHGVLGAHAERAGAFNEHDVDFLQAIANVLAEAIARRAAEQHVRHQALHDPLTGLPNRTLLLERIGHWIDKAARSHGSAALLFVDLDNFKVVNDVLGHEAGDELLAQVGERIARAMRASDTVARLGGDEFVVFCEDIAGEHHALSLVERLIEVLEAPFVVRQRHHHVTASVGIALAGASSSADDLMRDADAAMYRAKERGRNRYEVFDSEMHAWSRKWLETEADLRRALAGGELVNVYQPIVQPGDGRITGFEALVRWQHPTRGMLGPADFIEVAEQSGLIVDVGAQVLREACAEAARWQTVSSRSGGPVHVSVNVSPRQLADPGLVATVVESLEAAGLDPSLLSLEITESALVGDAQSTLDVLSRLKELGIGIELDDFGTGYSSLTYLRRFPIDAVKIDRSFVSGLATSPEDSAIVGAVISLGRSLGLPVIAEGVETNAQAEQLAALGCGLAQGFLFSRPMDAQATHELLSG
jgi:diguanylate cyclase (GGDEF)-like protein